MLNVESLSLSAGQFRLEDVSFSVDKGEYFVLMGRTGSGKTLLLQSVAGLVRSDRGSIEIHGNDVTGLEPRFRDVGYIPQDSGLFPHLDVERNIMFPLAVRGIPRREAAEQAASIAEAVGVARLLGRSVRHLSGGERQKVALSRALVYKPSLLLLDEPLSALDEPSRREIARTLKRVQGEFGVATIHVCHNSSEARELADRAGILSDGRLKRTCDIGELGDNGSILI